MNTATLDNKNSTSVLHAGMFTLALRLVVGWTYFSAFWRRMVIDYKLDPEEAGYIGEKFNAFLPNALGIKPMIEHLVSNPESLWWAMLAFTLIEAVVGFFFMFGILTRLMSVGVFSLAMGILLGSGWLGTTCLDEWQIGVLGVAAGFTIFFSGGGKYSLDNYLLPKLPKKYQFKWLPWLSSGDLPISVKNISKIVFAGSIGILFLTLFTNQVFHGGVWGTLHNKSVKPKIEISDATLDSNKLNFTVFRVEGADVYGSFLIGVSVKNTAGELVLDMKGEDLAQFPVSAINNAYVAKVKPGKHSMIIPLGSKAELTLDNTELHNLPAGDYELILTDISGATWTANISK